MGRIKQWWNILTVPGYHRGWQAAHNKRVCGHPLAFYQDPNWPESERNYNAETGESDPPMKYRCWLCYQHGVIVRQGKHIERLREHIRKYIDGAARR